ncbi:hypothetical protein ALC57_04422, partial [Trachymyrmex cornetzi]
EQLVDEYIKKWDVLKLPNGYLLWETVKELIIELAEIEIPVSDSYGRDLLKQYYAAPEDKRDVIILYILPSLCCKRGRGKSIIRARLQPILIVVGQTITNISATYVQIDSVRYKPRTPVAALDACLKAYHALDAVYPQECKAVWYFVQQYFYNLYLKEDENICRVISLISSLKGLASKKE